MADCTQACSSQEYACLLPAPAPPSPREALLYLRATPSTSRIAQAANTTSSCSVDASTNMMKGLRLRCPTQVDVYGQWWSKPGGREGGMRGRGER